MSFATSPEQVRQFVDEMYAAWSRHEPDRLDAILHDDAVHEDVASGHMCHGKDEIKQLINGAVGFSSDFRSTMTTLTIAGDTAMTEWIIEGTHTGPVATPSGPVPESGRNFRLRGASLILFKESKIARVTDYYDMATFLKQLGCTIRRPGA